MDGRGRLVPGPLPAPFRDKGASCRPESIHVGWIPQILEAVWILWVSCNRMAFGGRGLVEGGGGEKAGWGNGLDQTLYPTRRRRDLGAWHFQPLFLEGLLSVPAATPKTSFCHSCSKMQRSFCLEYTPCLAGSSPMPTRFSWRRSF